MFRFSRAYQHTAEFEARQMGFEFAVVARAVLEVARSTKAALVEVAQDFIKALRPARPVKKPVQLVLEWSAIATSSSVFCHQGVPA